MSFIELCDFIIYLYLNKKTNFIISHFPKPIYGNQFNYVCPANFYATLCKALLFYQNSPKIKVILEKNAKYSSAGGSAPRSPCFRKLGAFPPDPQPTAAGGFAPTPTLASGALWLRPRPQISPPPPLRIPGYAPGYKHVTY